MTTRVCLVERQDIWDGYGLKAVIHDWLTENAGFKASDATDFMWNRRVGWRILTNHTKHDPRYVVSTEDEAIVNYRYLHFYFKDPAKAILFKLTWGGQ